MSKKTINAQYAASTWQYDITVKNTGTRVTWKNWSDSVLRPNGLSDWQITRSDQSSH